MKLKTGDQVLIISGKDKGRKGKVAETFPQEGKLVVEGINMRKKHSKPRRQGEKGQIVEIQTPMYSSNVKFICPKCTKAVRVGHRKIESKKLRVCKKCGEEV